MAPCLDLERPSQLRRVEAFTARRDRAVEAGHRRLGIASTSGTTVRLSTSYLQAQYESGVDLRFAPGEAPYDDSAFVSLAGSNLNTLWAKDQATL